MRLFSVVIFDLLMILRNENVGNVFEFLCVGRQGGLLKVEKAQTRCVPQKGVFSTFVIVIPKEVLEGPTYQFCFL